MKIFYLYKNNLSNINGDFRQGIVHRIDKDTSGLIDIAKNKVTNMVEINLLILIIFFLIIIIFNKEMSQVSINQLIKLSEFFKTCFSNKVKNKTENGQIFFSKGSFSFEQCTMNIFGSKSGHLNNSKN